MKKTVIVASLLLTASLAVNTLAETTVTGQNWVGYVKLPVPPAENIALLGINFEGVGATNGEGIALNELLNTENLIGANRDTGRDQVYIWDPVELKYDNYSYNDGDFYIFNTDTIANPIVYPGQALWFRSSPLVPEDRELFSLGQVNLAETTVINIPEGLSLLSSPYPVALDFSQIDWLGQGATAVNRKSSSDQVHIFQDGTYYNYYLRPDGTWTDFSDNVVEIILEPGVATWYRAMNSYENIFSRPFDID